MASRLRLAKGIGCAFLASSIVYAASGNNSPEKLPPLFSRLKSLQPVVSTGEPETDCQVDGKNGHHASTYKYSLKESIRKTRELCERARVEHGLPGLTIAVTVNGKLVYDEGFGYADVENKLKMESNAVMRIASISKSMTMAMMAKLIEEGKVNIDLPVQTYLPQFPEKQMDGKPVTITTRHLLSHLSGIRHYKRKGEKDNNDDSEMHLKEYFIKDKFETIEKSLELFMNDELHHAPGTKYLYSSHAWTVVAGVIEKIVETPFPKHAKSMFSFWGLNNTYLDEHEPLIYNRTRYYTRNKHGKLKNSPYVDNSYKWSGGGFLSTVHDLTQFANMMLYCYQHCDNQGYGACENGLPKRPFLKNSTICQLWTGDARTLQKHNPDFLYGLGFVVGDTMRNCVFCKEKDLLTVHHSGGAVGASSILVLAFPKKFRFGFDSVDEHLKHTKEFPKEGYEADVIGEIKAASDVKGVSVAMITNLTDVGMTKTALDIANLFKWLI